MKQRCWDSVGVQTHSRFEWPRWPNTLPLKTVQTTENTRAAYDSWLHSSLTVKGSSPSREVQIQLLFEQPSYYLKFQVRTQKLSMTFLILLLWVMRDEKNPPPKKLGSCFVSCTDESLTHSERVKFLVWNLSSWRHVPVFVCFFCFFSPRILFCLRRRLLFTITTTNSCCYVPPVQIQTAQLVWGGKKKPQTNRTPQPSLAERCVSEAHLLDIRQDLPWLEQRSLRPAARLGFRLQTSKHTIQLVNWFLSSLINLSSWQWHS